MKHWKILKNDLENDHKYSIPDIINILLDNRNITSKKDIDNFLTTNIDDISLQSSGINPEEFKKFKKTERIFGKF